MVTVKQKMALDRGNDIRDTRCAIEKLYHLISAYRSMAGGSSLSLAMAHLISFHNTQFGAAKCKICGNPCENPVDALCNNCIQEL